MILILNSTPFSNIFNNYRYKYLWEICKIAHYFDSKKQKNKNFYYLCAIMAIYLSLV